MFELCLNFHTEIIPIHNSTKKKKEEGEEKNDNQQSSIMLMREKEGMERLLEGLESNIWSTIEMVDQREEERNEKEEEEEEIVTTPPSQHDTTPPTSTSTNNDGGDPSSHHRVRREEGREEESMEEEEEEEDDLFEFGELLSTMKQSMGDINNLSDEERRNNAEEMIMKLVNLLGDESDEDEGTEN